MNIYFMWVCACVWIHCMQVTSLVLCINHARIILLCPLLECCCCVHSSCSFKSIELNSTISWRSHFLGRPIISHLGSNNAPYVHQTLKGESWSFSISNIHVHHKKNGSLYNEFTLGIEVFLSTLHFTLFGKIIAIVWLCLLFKRRVYHQTIWLCVIQLQ